MSDAANSHLKSLASHESAASLQELLTATRIDEPVRDQAFRKVYETVLAESSYLEDKPNFTRISTQDLVRMFDLYDTIFLGGEVRSALAAQNSKLHFALSRRLTRSGGQTKRTRPGRSQAFSPAQYEIAVSVPVLFATFSEVDRPIRACGRMCYDRLEALQRIMEHELLHLAEMLGWDRSNCSASRFRILATNIFGHTESHHQMITPQERAIVHFGVKPGARVSFDWEGKTLHGIVNSIRRRATVLVPSRHGTPYSDGQRYEKFYVPVEQLKPA